MVVHKYHMMSAYGLDLVESWSELITMFDLYALDGMDAMSGYNRVNLRVRPCNAL
jgi:hypothetical protein